MSELYISRVKNGWVVVLGQKGMGCRGDEYVFSSPESLSGFIEEVAKEQENGAESIPEA